MSRAARSLADVCHVQARGRLLLGLWSRHTVEPAAHAAGGGHEVCFTVEGRPRVDALCKERGGRGLTVAQAPVEMEFGYTFVMLDPDQHRLRVNAQQ